MIITENSSFHVLGTMEPQYNEGTREIGLLYQEFIISRFFSIHFTITGL